MPPNNRLLTVNSLLLPSSKRSRDHRVVLLHWLNGSLNLRWYPWHHPHHHHPHPLHHHDHRQHRWQLWQQTIRQHRYLIPIALIYHYTTHPTNEITDSWHFNNAVVWRMLYVPDQIICHTIRMHTTTGFISHQQWKDYKERQYHHYQSLHCHHRWHHQHQASKKKERGWTTGGRTQERGINHILS